MVNVKREGIILKPTKLPFENKGVFNPACIRVGKYVHMFYRAWDKNQRSTIGYCKLDGPLKVVERNKKPFFPKKKHDELHYEDPRIVKIGKKYHLTYILYDGLNVFQRPKRSKLLNGVKLEICQKMIDKKLLISESRERGFNEHPAVFAEVKKRTEEMMVNKLFEEVIVIDTVVSPEEVEAFWAENSDNFLDRDTGEQMELDAARNSIGDHIRTLRKDVMLRGLIAEWKDEFGVDINEEALMKTASWAALVPLENSPVAGPSVPPTQ